MPGGPFKKSDKVVQWHGTQSARDNLGQGSFVTFHSCDMTFCQDMRAFNVLETNQPFHPLSADLF